MEKQVFLEFDLRFNLRQSKQNKPTIVYAVFTYNGKQVKINTNTKVYPSQWNAKRQIANISNGQTRLDNNNNKIVNDAIKRIEIVFNEQKHYLCENTDEISNLYNIMRKAINPKYKNRMANVSERLATDIMREFATQKSPSVFEQYKTIINVFEKFLKENKIENKLSLMNYDTFKLYQDYLCNAELKVTTINNKIGVLTSLLKEISRSKNYNYRYAQTELNELENVKDKRSKADRRSKQVTLNESQIMKLYELQGLNESEQEFKDLFCLQCWTGQRVSDILKLFNKKNHKDNNTIGFKNKKTKTDVVIKLDIEGYQIKEILQRYIETGFHHIDFETLTQDEDNEKKMNSMNSFYNKIIKRLGEKAELNDIVEYVVQKGRKTTNKKEVKWRLIHSHSARHSYVTNMLRRGVPKDLIKITTGHTDDEMIDEIYQHLTMEDNAKKLHQGMNALNTNLDITPILNKEKIEVIETIDANNINKTEEKYVKSVEEAKEVLVYLGGDATEFIHIYDITLLMAMIGRYEGKILNELGLQTTEKFKELFNKTRDTKERMRLLHEFKETIQKKGAK